MSISHLPLTGPHIPIAQWKCSWHLIIATHLTRGLGSTHTAGGRSILLPELEGGARPRRDRCTRRHGARPCFATDSLICMQPRQQCNPTRQQLSFSTEAGDGGRFDWGLPSVPRFSSQPLVPRARLFQEVMQCTVVRVLQCMYISCLEQRFIFLRQTKICSFLPKCLSAGPLHFAMVRCPANLIAFRHLRHSRFLLFGSLGRGGECRRASRAHTAPIL